MGIKFHFVHLRVITRYFSKKTPHETPYTSMPSRSRTIIALLEEPWMRVLIWFLYWYLVILAGEGKDLKLTWQAYTSPTLVSDTPVDFAVQSPPMWWCEYCTSLHMCQHWTQHPSPSLPVKREPEKWRVRWVECTGDNRAIAYSNSNNCDHGCRKYQLARFRAQFDRGEVNMVLLREACTTPTLEKGLAKCVDDNSMLKRLLGVDTLRYRIKWVPAASEGLRTYTIFGLKDEPVIVDQLPDLCCSRWLIFMESIPMHDETECDSLDVGAIEGNSRIELEMGHG